MNNKICFIIIHFLKVNIGLYIQPEVLVDELFLIIEIHAQNYLADGTGHDLRTKFRIDTLEQSDVCFLTSLIESLTIFLEREFRHINIRSVLGRFTNQQVIDSVGILFYTDIQHSG